MKDVNQSKYSSDYLIEKMMEDVTRKDELSQKYDAAKDIDDLMLIASKRICISAAGIMFSLKGPKRGNIVLRLMKKLRPQSYKSFWDRNNNLYAQCVFLIIFKLNKFIQSNFDFSPTQSFYKNLMAWAGMYFYRINRYNQEEKELFKWDFINAIIEFENNPPKDENEQLSRIMA